MTQTVKVPLSENTIYVTGTVNGVDKVWTQEENNIWTTQADVSTDGIYRIALYIIYSDGKTTEDSITIYYGLTLITDRTQSDVTRWKTLTSKGWDAMTDDEKSEWSAGIKGAYNATDMNRVQSAMDYIRNKFLDYGYSVPGYVENKFWFDSDIPNENQLNQYLGNVLILKNIITLQNQPELPESLSNLTYNEANNIEKVLELVDKTLSKAISIFWYSGELYSGEV